MEVQWAENEEGVFGFVAIEDLGRIEERLATSCFIQSLATGKRVKIIQDMHEQMRVNMGNGFERLRLDNSTNCSSIISI